MKQWEWLEKLSYSDSEHAKLLDIRECMLEVQKMLLQKLTAAEDHFKKVAVIVRFFIIKISFEKWVKEIVKVIQALQYWEWKPILHMKHTSNCEFRLYSDSLDENESIKQEWDA